MTQSLDLGGLVRGVLSVTGGPVLHHPPHVTKEDVMAVMDQLRDLGSYDHMNKFEAALAYRCGRKYAVAVSSGTSALEVALAAMGVRANSKVAVPALGFVAAANSVSHRGATPILIDVTADDFGISPLCLKRIGPSVDAVIAIHNLGHPCRIDEIVEIAHFHGVPVIEDAAEALGSVAYGEKPCGSNGVLSVLSFNLNKIVTTGGGGAVLCDDQRLQSLIRRLATTARVEHQWFIEHDHVAWNHRMPMLCAALGLSQLQRLDLMVAAKRRLSAAYEVALSDVEGVEFHNERPGTVSNHWLPTIMVPPHERDSVLTALRNAGVYARAMFTPLNQLKPYLQKGFPTADAVFRSAVCLPAGIELAERYL